MRKRQFVGQSPTARAVCAETGNSDAIQGTIELAEAFTKECEVTYAARNLELLASFKDAKIQKTAMRSAGELVWTPHQDNEFLILVNEDHPLQRQNFSICHELGHLLMPNYDPSVGRHVDWETMRWNPEEEEEYLCDVAAAEILMPRRIFKPRLRACGLCIEALIGLSEEFEASLEATAVNVVRAGLGDVAVIVWTLGYRKNEVPSSENLSLFDDSTDPLFAPVEKKYRVKFAYGHGSMRDFYFPTNQSTDNDSLIASSANRLLTNANTRTSGLQILSYGQYKSEFYTESYAYWSHKDGELQPKVVSLVFLEDPAVDEW